MNMQQIQLIALGYEWVCPNCKKCHHVIEVPKEDNITCRQCKHEFEVGMPEHTYE